MLFQFNILHMQVESVGGFPTFAPWLLLLHAQGDQPGGGRSQREPDTDQQYPADLPVHPFPVDSAAGEHNEDNKTA